MDPIPLSIPLLNARNTTLTGLLGPTGEAIPPYGDTPFEVLVGLYAKRAKALADAGAQAFLVEDITNMAEYRAAILGVREMDLPQPIVVLCPCDEEGRTATDADVLAIAIVAAGMGASAFGLKTDDPAVAREQLERIHQYLDLPLLEGLTPASLPPVERDPDVIPCASETEARFITPDVDVGEIIPCSSDLVEAILEAEEERPVGALRISVLDADDLEIFSQEQYAVKDALCIWSDVPEIMESALRAYQGRAFYDGTADLEPDFLSRMARKYGLILL